MNQPKPLVVDKKCIYLTKNLISTLWIQRKTWIHIYEALTLLLQQKNCFLVVVLLCIINWCSTFNILYGGRNTFLQQQPNVVSAVKPCTPVKSAVRSKPRSRLFTFPPLCSKSCMTSVWLFLAACWSAVIPAPSTLSTGIPSPNKRTTLLSSPRYAARVKLSTSCGSISMEEINVQVKQFPLCEARVHHSLCSII